MSLSLLSLHSIGILATPASLYFSHASEHVMLMLTWARVCAFADVQRGQWLASVATNQALQRASWAHGYGLCARAGREKRVQRPCVEGESSPGDLSHWYHAV